MKSQKRINLVLMILSIMLLAGCTELEEQTTEVVDDDSSDIVDVANVYDGMNTTPIEEDPMVSSVVYPTDEVIEVNIVIDDVDYQNIINNATLEEYYECDITYNGYTLYNVGIRAKGNSSLRDVAEQNGDRFSFNIDLNLYEDQDLFGIDKLILNNMFMDPTYMAEFLAYEALNSLDATASRTTYTAVSINGEYFGLYLSVEHVSNEFLDTNLGNSDSEFYKPDIETGANLDYVSDTFNYTGLVDKNTEEDEDSNNDYIIELMSAIESGEEVDDIFNVEGFLKYLAVSTYTVNLDSYQGGMYHNYYLYNNAGTFDWIAWDLNMAFNGFPMLNLSDSEAVTFLIDEPTASAMSNYPLIDAIFSNEEYVELYHTYMQELLDNYFNPTIFEERVNEVYTLIEGYVETDPSSFYTYTEFTNAVYQESSQSYSLIQFVNERSENVQDQLDGTIPSTNNGNGNGLSSGMPGGMPGGDRPR